MMMPEVEMLVLVVRSNKKITARHFLLDEGHIFGAHGQIAACFQLSLRQNMLNRLLDFRRDFIVVDHRRGDTLDLCMDLAPQGLADAAGNLLEAFDDLIADDCIKSSHRAGKLCGPRNDIKSGAPQDGCYAYNCPLQL